MTNKTELIVFRVSEEENELIQKAALRVEKKKSAFLRETALRAANDNAPQLTLLKNDLVRLNIDLSRTAGALRTLSLEPSMQACEELVVVMNKQIVRAEKLIAQCRKVLRS